ncbi:MAG: beta-N-acetylglucosaminidase (EC 3.2.1.52) [Olavius algarvensis Delta 4 endosymbiont]|nr:MAG: beta-N-acetylglucosaminidase (EC 3.2.1.52) [Olavius algarvensis Delta 4 endosymbiont]
MMETDTFTIEQLAGQRLMVGFDGTDLSADLKNLISTYKVGGLILFTRNIESPNQLRDLCADVQAYAADAGQPPLFIAIDQEGGQVARLKAPFTEFPGTPPLKNRADAEDFARITADELTAVGINMNMAPVMDVNDPQIDSIMIKRAFSHDPDVVAEIGTAVIAGLQKRKIMAVAKHFPGIGRTTLDSHVDQPLLEASVNKLEADLAPFSAAINHHAAGIMLSHILYSALDLDLPASLSVKIARDLLRKRMGYDGLVLTDDLDMGAISNHFAIDTAVDCILTADIDLMLVCHKGPAQDLAFARTCRWLARESGHRTRGRQSVKRIMRLKQQYLY